MDKKIGMKLDLIISELLGKNASPLLVSRYFFVFFHFIFCNKGFLLRVKKVGWTPFREHFFGRGAKWFRYRVSIHHPVGFKDGTPTRRSTYTRNVQNSPRNLCSLSGEAGWHRQVVPQRPTFWPGVIGWGLGLCISGFSRLVPPLPRISTNIDIKNDVVF